MRRSTQRFGGLIDHHSMLSFTFNSCKMTGYKGDTLASALLANGQKLVGRSFKYHRPRGIFGIGSEEPNALMHLHQGAHGEPNTRATTVELFDGLKAHSQNHLFSLNYDLLAINDFLSPFFSAGFYYKTFMWPKAFWEKLYEPLIRSTAGLGTLSILPDPDCYDNGYLHCDLLIVGAGPAGLAAAIVAGRAGARVLIADEDFLPGGRLNFENLLINELPGNEWAALMAAELDSMDNVQLLRRTTVFGAYDHGIFGAIERRTDHLKEVNDKPRQVLWRIYSKRSLICAGATERSIAFPSNDRPNIMLAGAARGYLNRFGVAVGKRTAIFTNNDNGWLTAIDYSNQGLEVPIVIDTRNSSSVNIPDGMKHKFGGRVINTKGRRNVQSILLADGRAVKIDCLAVSGGWSPNIHLTCHKRNKPIWNNQIVAFVPGSDLDQGMSVAGAANGSLDLSSCLKEGIAAAEMIAHDLGYNPLPVSLPKTNREQVSISAFWHVKEGIGRAWLDLQNDVTVDDIEQAHTEGFQVAEHIKRYTTLGMATDQGKTSNVMSLAILSSITGKSIEETGTTIYRPPYTPVTIGAFAGRSRSKNFRPLRRIPSHNWAESNGAEFIEVGNWLRPQWYRKRGEEHWRQIVDREVSTTRKSVGICDVTTLGKIDIQGRDANKFLNKVYANGFQTLQVGKIRYGLMLREDGIVYDDGTTARLAENHYLMTTTTANAGLVFRQLEFARQCLWPRMDVHLISVTDGWAQFAVAGPNSRKLLQKLIDPCHAITNEAFPFMTYGEFTICGGATARLFRISFSGELAYEIAVPARLGNSMMALLMDAGKEFNAVPYGTEALGVMRIEKGHIAGNELDGRTTANQLGLERMISKKKDSIGSILSQRPGVNEKDDFRLMGFRPVDKSNYISAGAHFFENGVEMNLENDQGWMSSAAYSPTLGHSIGLGFIKRGNSRIGEKVIAADPLRGQKFSVEIISSHFFDPDGERLRG